MVELEGGGGGRKKHPSGIGFRHGGLRPLWQRERVLVVSSWRLLSSHSSCKKVRLPVFCSAKELSLITVSKTALCIAVASPGSGLMFKIKVAKLPLWQSGIFIGLFTVALRPQRLWTITVLGTGSPGWSPWLSVSHSYWGSDSELWSITLLIVDILYTKLVTQPGQVCWPMLLLGCWPVPTF